MWKGCLVALVTPMKSDGAVDFNALQQLLDWQVESKTKGVVILGTTGEAPTISSAERQDIIQFTVNHAKKRYPVIVGTGTNATDSTIEYTWQAKELGADACLVVTPYYNKPPQAGLFEHYAEVAKAVDIPIILYNVPGRTGCDMLPETTARLSQIDNIIGIKEARGDLGRVKVLRERCREGFLLLTGNDDETLAFMNLGGDGVVSVTANVAPTAMVRMCEAVLQGDHEQAQTINAILSALHKNLFVESNPIPVKWCLFRMGKIEPGIRLPLMALSDSYRQDLEKILHEALQQLKRLSV